MFSIANSIAGTEFDRPSAKRAEYLPIVYIGGMSDSEFGVKLMKKYRNMTWE